MLVIGIKNPDPVLKKISGDPDKNCNRFKFATLTLTDFTGHE